MSVDTHLEGKNLAPYRKINQDDVEIMLSRKLDNYANAVRFGVKGFGPFKRLDVAIEHEHSPSCGHH